MDQLIQNLLINSFVEKLNSRVQDIIKKKVFEISGEVIDFKIESNKIFPRLAKNFQSGVETWYWDTRKEGENPVKLLEVCPAKGCVTENGITKAFIEIKEY